jgi:hypothetical protein
MILMIENKTFISRNDGIYSFNFNKNTSNFTVKGYFV